MDKKLKEITLIAGGRTISLGIFISNLGERPPTLQVTRRDTVIV